MNRSIYSSFTAIAVTFLASVLSASAGTTDAPFDFNGDSKTDFTVARNNGGGANGQVTWYTLFSGTGTAAQTDWGIAIDTHAPGDYDGDGKDDVAIWRSGAPGVAGFYILQSSNGAFRFLQFGQTGDIPVVADYTGDGLDDGAIYREGATSGAQSYFWYQASSGPLAGIAVATDWGIRGDDPVPGDFTGDGKADFCVQRGIPLGFPPINYAFFYMHPGTGGANAPGNDTAIQLGFATDAIVAGDYDGDGKTEVAVARAQGGQYIWYYFPSSGGPLVAQAWGLSASDSLAPGDYDGDGRNDVAVWRRTAEGGAYYFYVNGSMSGPTQTAWGLCTNVPLGNCDVPIAVDGVR